MHRFTSALRREFRQNPCSLTFSILSFVGVTVSWLLGKLFDLFGWEWLYAIYGVNISLLLALVIWYYRSNTRLGRLARSGVQDYYPSYSPETSIGFWRQCNSNYRYLGITGGTFINDLKHWMNNEGQDLQYQILLLDPQSPFLEQVEGERLAPLSNDISPQNQAAVHKQVKAKQSLLQATVDTLLSTKPAQNMRVHIKIYDAYPTYWMEIFDQRQIFMGILSPKRPGHQSPVLVLEQKGDYSFFHSMMDQWHRLWQEGKDLI